MVCTIFSINYSQAFSSHLCIFKSVIPWFRIYVFSTFIVCEDGNTSWPSGVVAPGIEPASRPADEMVDSANFIWRMFLARCTLHVNISTNQLLGEEESLVSEGEPTELDYSSSEQGNLNGSYLEFSLSRRRNDTGDLFQNRTLNTSLRNGSRTNRTRYRQLSILIILVHGCAANLIKMFRGLERLE